MRVSILAPALLLLRCGLLLLGGLGEVIYRSRTQRVWRVCELGHVAKLGQIADLDVVLLFLDHLLLLMVISACSRADWSGLDVEILRK